MFDLAMERGQLDQWTSELRLVRTALENAELRAFLDHAKVPMARKVQTIREVLAATDGVVQNLLALLVSRGLVDLLPEVEEGYRHMVDQYRGREEVEVFSAVPLEASERDSISRFLTDLIQKEVLLDTRVDPSVLGGLVMRVGDKLIDGSTRTRLQQLGQRLQRGSAEIGV